MSNVKQVGCIFTGSCQKYFTFIEYYISIVHNFHTITLKTRIKFNTNCKTNLILIYTSIKQHFLKHFFDTF